MGRPGGQCSDVLQSTRNSSHPGVSLSHRGILWYHGPQFSYKFTYSTEGRGTWIGWNLDEPYPRALLLSNPIPLKMFSGGRLRITVPEKGRSKEG